VPVDRIDCTDEQRRVACDHTREEELVLHEGLAGARQLEARQHSSSRGHWADQDARRTPAPGEAADRLRQLVVLGQLFRADFSLRDPRAFKLGA
jgi:hypothetical protein